jgi:hypothetical protein
MWADKLLEAILEESYSKGWPERFKAAFEAFSDKPGDIRIARSVM